MKLKPLRSISEHLTRNFLLFLVLILFGSHARSAAIYSNNFNNSTINSPQVKNANLTATWSGTPTNVYSRNDGSTTGLALNAHNHTYILTIKVAEGFQAEVTSISMARLSADNGTFQISVNSVGYGASFPSTSSKASITRTKTVSKLRNTVSFTVFVANGNNNATYYSQIDDFIINGTVTAYDPADEAVPDANGVLYVDKSINTPGDGSSWNKALRQMTHAIAATARPINVHQIWAAAGSYSPAASASFSLVENVKIYGGFAGFEESLTERDILNNPTYLTGNGRTVIYNDGIDNTAVLDGFYIKGGVGFPSSTTSYGGGMYNTSSSPVISNCIFTENTTDVAKATSRGGAMMNINSSPTIIQCLFTKNKASGTSLSQGGAIYNSSSSPIILNCTFSENIVSGGTANGGGIYNAGSSSPAIQNSIIWNNTGVSIYAASEGTDAPDITYNLIQGGFGGSHNTIDADPQFVSPTDGDYRLLTTSPALNVGNPSTNLTNFPVNEAAQPLDLQNSARVSNFTIDLGAFETHLPTKWHVAASSSATNPKGGTWEDAFKTLQEAVQQASEGDEIWVAKGQYLPAAGNSFSMIKGVKFYGSFKGDETAPDQRPMPIPRGNVTGATVLKGNGSRVIVNDGNGITEDDILDGFTISSGTAANGAGMFNRDVSVQIVNCTFIQNNAEDSGGGIYNENSPVKIYKSYFSENKALNGSGGGVASFGNGCLLVNSVLVKNSAPEGSGGAIYSFNDITITNCTISLNTAGESNSVYCGFFGSIYVYNSIVYGNSGGISSSFGTTPVIYTSIVQELGTSQSGVNVDGDTDPQFVNPDGSDLHLRACSPAISRGFTDFLQPDQLTDLDGNNRVVNTAPDMGAYEFQELPTPLSIPLGNASVTLPVFGGFTPFSEDCATTAYVEPSGDDPLRAYMSAKVYIGSGPTLTSGTKVFVKRHLDLTPINQSGSQATVTLLFTKQEFDDYNTTYGNANNAKLPEHLKVVQYHGTSPTGLPGSYTGTTEVVNDVTVSLANGIYSVTFAVSAFSGFFVTGQPEGALPVTLTSFEASKNESKALLTWQTSGESHSSAFELEHSNEGKVWERIGEVAASGDTFATVNYSFLHQQPNVGDNLYRLKMIDQDGTYSFSHIRNLNFADEAPVAIYPNPVFQSSKVQIKGVLPGTIKDLIIYDTDGKIAQQSSDVMSDELNVSNLTSGTFVVHIILKSGVTQSAKLVIAK